MFEVIKSNNFSALCVKMASCSMKRFIIKSDAGLLLILIDKSLIKWLFYVLLIKISKGTIEMISRIYQEPLAVYMDEQEEGD